MRRFRNVANAWMSSKLLCRARLVFWSDNTRQNETENKSQHGSVSGRIGILRSQRMYLGFSSSHTFLYFNFEALSIRVPWKLRLQAECHISTFDGENLLILWNHQHPSNCIPVINTSLLKPSFLYSILVVQRNWTDSSGINLFISAIYIRSHSRVIRISVSVVLRSKFAMNRR